MAVSDQDNANEAKIAEFSAKLDEVESQDKAQKVVVAKKFDVRAVAVNTRIVQVAVDPVLGEIRYGILNRRELCDLHLEKVRDEQDRVDLIGYAMLKKADSELSLEDYDAMPFDVKAKVLTVLSRAFTSFLSSPPSSG